ncbi:hypothetical protein B0H11DRAFT_174855 [Mycena galericulata]|nr:hypothetical protein B0H11DRAFT_174855 [Mycena galericulata]
MSSVSTFISLAAIASSAAPVLSAPIPVSHDITARGLGSLIQGLVGAGEDTIENLIGGFFGADSSGSSSASTSTDTANAGTTATPVSPVETRQLAGLAEGLAGKVLGKVAGSVGSDIGGEIESILGKVFDKSNSTSKRELDARLSIPSSVITGALKKLGEGVISGAALGGLEKLLGGDSSATTTTAAASATGAASSRRDFSDLSDAEVNTLLEYINDMGTKATRSVSLNELD